MDTGMTELISILRCISVWCKIHVGSNFGTPRLFCAIRYWNKGQYINQPGVAPPIDPDAPKDAPQIGINKRSLQSNSPEKDPNNDDPAWIPPPEPPQDEIKPWRTQRANGFVRPSCSGNFLSSVTIKELIADVNRDNQWHDGDDKGMNLESPYVRNPTDVEEI
jgi:hypothetical protein